LADYKHHFQTHEGKRMHDFAIYAQDHVPRVFGKQIDNLVLDGFNLRYLSEEGKNQLAEAVRRSIRITRQHFVQNSEEQDDTSSGRLDPKDPLAQFDDELIRSMATQILPRLEKWYTAKANHPRNDGPCWFDEGADGLDFAGASTIPTSFDSGYHTHESLLKDPDTHSSDMPHLSVDGIPGGQLRTEGESRHSDTINSENLGEDSWMSL
jgi:hypothetical protein